MISYLHKDDSIHILGLRAVGSHPPGDISDRPCSKQLLLSTRLMVTFPAIGRHQYQLVLLGDRGTSE